MTNLCLGFKPSGSSFSFAYVSSVFFLVYVKFRFMRFMFKCYLHSIQVLVVPDVQFGSYVQVPVSKC